MDLPALPEHENRWPQNVYTVEGIISNIYNATIRILRSNDAEPTRVAYHYDALSTEALPLLEAIESDTSPADYQLLHDWLLVCARLIGEVAAMLKDISGNLHVGNAERANVIIPELVTLGHQQCRLGRRKKIINFDFVMPPKSGPEPRFELEPLRTGPLVQSQVRYFCWTEPPNRSEVRYFPGAREPVQTRPDRFEPDVFLSNLDSQTGNEASYFCDEVPKLKDKLYTDFRLSAHEWGELDLMREVLQEPADAQQSFSATREPTVWRTIPVLEYLQEMLQNMANSSKFSRLSTAIEAGVANLSKWYGKTDDTDVYFICLALDPNYKVAYAKDKWAPHFFEMGMHSLGRVVLHTQIDLLCGALRGASSANVRDVTGRVRCSD
ncbi:uncharacterized protein F5891DRAFT_1244701 [Suillus fuscotomentosus]|uniref:Uncharacterized protein n=1 Tax=Suillus fuscotomentosus TaxID=1912939 RepID=A0AAD4EHK9_9AGAM|nr:uncharacterized protein F5891DRAFT_1244701 [Suillus fuscotomentosus]KAG1906385.1 hypothetical protein F5891DRAFT_1244701 [Suillus fuscotomentosus]